MTADLLKYIRDYGKYDETEEDSLLSSLGTAAEEYLAGGGVRVELVPYNLYKLAVAGIVLHWHDNRAAVSGSAPPSDFEPGIRTVINQLKLKSIRRAEGGCPCE